MLVGETGGRSSGCFPLGVGAVPVRVSPAGLGKRGRREGVSLPAVSFAGGSTLSRKGPFISSDYLYPLLMQSRIRGWETGPFGIKSPPRPNAFCLLHQLP